jgi:uncharacterized protein
VLVLGCTQPLATANRPVRVDDEANLISPAAEQRLTAELEHLEQRTSDQLAVKTVTSLGGESIDSVSLKTARQMKLGVKGKDNGVLLLVAPAEKKVRIETGCGTAGVLSDGEAAVIVAQMVQSFRSGAMEEGIELGARAINRELTEHPSGPLRRVRDKRCS